MEEQTNQYFVGKYGIIASGLGGVINETDVCMYKRYSLEGPKFYQNLEDLAEDIAEKFGSDFENSIDFKNPPRGGLNGSRFTRLSPSEKIFVKSAIKEQLRENIDQIVQEGGK